MKEAKYKKSQLKKFQLGKQYIRERKKTIAEKEEKRGKKYSKNFSHTIIVEEEEEKGKIYSILQQSQSWQNRRKRRRGRKKK